MNSSTLFILGFGIMFMTCMGGVFYVMLKEKEVAKNETPFTNWGN